MKIVLIAGLLVLTLVTLAGCVAGPNEMVNTPNEEGRVAGFWQGLWHGIIAPVTFVISLFSDKVHVFETHNNGNWYVFGFLLGLTAVWGGGGSAASRRR
jgi:4-amino-4-deoxy-L-arabinose transferase-like glycosyltransferase